jgi:hypothetical protein
MSLYQIAAILGYSSVFAAVFGLIRSRKVDPAYQPFLIIVCLGFLNHILSLLLVRYYGSSTVNGNVFVLVESLLYIWQFHNWGLFKKIGSIAFILAGLLTMVWIIDNLAIHNIHSLNSSFRIFSSLMMIALAINQLRSLVTKEKMNLLKNAIFIICSGMLIYFSYKAFIDVFFLVELNPGYAAINLIYSILVGINFFVNLLFAWAVLWIPKKISIHS